MFEVNVYLRQSYHGVRPKNARVCGVVEYMTKKGPATYSFLKEVEEVTAHRLALFGVVEAIKVLKKPCEVFIQTDDRFIADIWERELPEKWRQSGWKKGDGKEVRHADLWEEVLNAPHFVSMRFCVQNEYASWQERELLGEKPSPIS